MNSTTDEKKNASKLTVEERIFLLLDDLNVRTQKILDLEQSKIPIGKLEPETISVPPNGFIIDVDSPTQASNTRLRGPWLTINIANDAPAGGSNLQVYINNEDIFDTLKPGENRDYNMIQKGKIREVRLVPADGKSTVSVRFVGMP